ncbi:helix-turn-helix domain-containing protein [Methylobacterium sp. Leaf399]|uniref:helix-turn-helix domain-containing protein n=1 Tax=Methylobacterium sp. Leaf399 TaxID=1736364 RepID=UPI0009E72AE4|nr:helix-turn-helix domain-containing protein [Methylobacterium sp. Leaf399]
MDRYSQTEAATKAHGTRRGQQVARRPLAPGALAFRVPEAAMMFGLSRSKVWAMIAAGDLPARKIGAATVILRQDIESYLAGTAPRTKSAQ